jgi:hypothetical protein
LGNHNANLDNAPNNIAYYEKRYSDVSDYSMLLSATFRTLRICQIVMERDCHTVVMFRCTVGTESIIMVNRSVNLLHQYP